MYFKNLISKQEETDADTIIDIMENIPTLVTQMENHELNKEI